MADAPRIPRTSHPEGQPIHQAVEIMLMFAITAGGIAVLWGAWHLWRWFVRALIE